jgi:hypothetical protein
MIEQLVVNGCSYMETYAFGNGHVDLAERLDIRTPAGAINAVSLAIGGSANSRILRTVHKHSYNPGYNTLYVMGMTFVSRLEIPILDDRDLFEGRWTNPQNQQFQNRWMQHWTTKNSEQYVELKLKYESDSILDRTEDLMYRILATVDSIKMRGHRVLVFQQADNLYQEILADARFDPMRERPEIIDGLAWRAVAWQHEQGVQPTIYAPGHPYVPPEMVHPAAGHHQILNQYLTDYIQEHKILQ